MKRVTPVVTALLLFCLVEGASALDRSVPVKVTGWMRRTEFKSVLLRMKDNRYMPFKIIGKYDTEGIFYKGYYMPYPPEMNYFYAYFGMTHKGYQKRKNNYEAKGFEEIWHQVYPDAIGTELHQAVWIRLDTWQQPVDKNRSGGGETALQKKRNTSA